VGSDHPDRLRGLQLTRMLFSSLVGYLQAAQGVEALRLAPIALGMFAASFLAAVMRRGEGEASGD